MFEKITERCKSKAVIVLLSLVMIGGNTTAENLTEAISLMRVLITEIATLGGPLMNMIIVFSLITLVTVVIGAIAGFIKKSMSGVFNK